jgi:hypothetical protein
MTVRVADDFGAIRARRDELHRGPAHRAICDRTRCPECRRRNDVGAADSYFNFGGGLWAVCSVHAVRWYVTREMSFAPEVRDHPGEPLLDLAVVEGAVEWVAA